MLINMKIKLTVSSSPHVHAGMTTHAIMRDVLIALLPATLVGIYYFGLRAAIICIVSTGASVFFEWGFRKILKRKNTISDLSAAVTGLLIALNVPPALPIWMVVIGDLIAIVVAKQFFGGLGENFVNPALAARIILMTSFPKEMNTFVTPIDAVTTATPLSLAGTDAAPTLWQLFTGFHGGTIGEVCALALIIGGIYLLIRKVIRWIIPVCFIGTVAAVMFFAGGCSIYATAYQVLSGGLFLGAIFMATDYCTSPVTTWGKVIYGIGCGLITCLIRLYGSLAEGVSFAIIIMNILSPQIEKITMPKVFGTAEVKKPAKEGCK